MEHITASNETINYGDRNSAAHTNDDVVEGEKSLPGAESEREGGKKGAEKIDCRMWKCRRAVYLLFPLVHRDEIANLCFISCFVSAARRALCLLAARWQRKMIGSFVRPHPQHMHECDARDGKQCTVCLHSHAARSQLHTNTAANAEFLACSTHTQAARCSLNC